MSVQTRNTFGARLRYKPFRSGKKYEILNLNRKLNCRLWRREEDLDFSIHRKSPTQEAGQEHRLCSPIHRSMDSSGRRAVSAAISTIFLSTASILLLLLVPSAQAQQPLPLTSYCNSSDDDAGHYTINGTFSSNLYSLLKNLTSEATKTGFADGELGDMPDRVYGLVLCRGDVDQLTCHSCLSTGSQDVLDQCPRTKAAIIWYDYCLLRYSNTRFASNPETAFKDSIYSSINVTSGWPRFNQSLLTLLGQLRRYAAYNTSAPPPHMYATGLIEFSRQYPNITALVQCTRDLTTDGCNRCLDDIISYVPRCCDGGIHGIVLTRSCSLRYDIDSFYNVTPMISLPAISDSSSGPRPAPPSPTTPTANSNNNSDKENKKIGLGTIAAIVISAVDILSLLVCWMCYRRRKQGILNQRTSEQEVAAGESRLYDLRTIITATDNFSESNKLGEGGFGVVYKGKLGDGQDIAVKRLPTGTNQAREDLKNEVELLARLRHRNLVTLLGLCVEGEESMLIYEYVENKSLDGYLFDAMKREQLQWEQRHKIIWGIARGLLYLHEESQVKIIHRDLKAGNVLLDSRMNPKISDFGLARLFGGDRSQARTSRIVGTIGYMSPEYALRGQFSNKLDVFSFGVLVLEIVTGRRNSGSFSAENSTDLLAYAWDRWYGGRPSDIVDPCFAGGYSQAEASRCIEIALHCVQDAPTDRPTMSDVVLMLNDHSVSAHVPQPPAFIRGSVGEPNTVHATVGGEGSGHSRK